MSDHVRAVNDALLAIAALGLVAGGAIVLIDSVILRRVRRQRPDHGKDDWPSGTPRR